MVQNTNRETGQLFPFQRAAPRGPTRSADLRIHTATRTEAERLVSVPFTRYLATPQARAVIFNFSFGQNSTVVDRGLFTFTERLYRANHTLFSMKITVGYPAQCTNPFPSGRDVSPTAFYNLVEIPAAYCTVFLCFSAFNRKTTSFFPKPCNRFFLGRPRDCFLKLKASSSSFSLFFSLFSLPLSNPTRT